MHAEKCPLCFGKGTLPVNYKGEWIPRYSEQKTCHGCNGRGWVTVEDTPSVYPPPRCTCHLKGRSTGEIPCPIHG